MEITWRPIALEDLQNIRRHIAQDNPAAAERVRSIGGRVMILSVIHSARDWPERF